MLQCCLPNFPIQCLKTKVASKAESEPQQSCVSLQSKQKALMADSSRTWTPSVPLFKITSLSRK